MSDNSEKITVEVDATPASEGFGRIKTAASQADSAIDSLGSSADKAQGSLNSAGQAGSRAATGLSESAKAAGDAATGLNKAGKEAESTTSKFEGLMKSFFGGIRMKAIWDFAASGFQTATGFANEFIDRVSAVQRTISLLNNIPGSDVGSEFQYLVNIANKYGLSLQSIQNDYAKYTLSAQNSKLTNDQIQRSFEQVAMAVRTLHMNSQQAQFTFLALEQMMSKGQVSLQELRRQFAERIPGAMQALAREMGVTMPNLLQFITKVGAASDKILPVLGNALQRLFQDGLPNAVRALDAERNRLQTSITTFFEKVINDGGTEGMSKLLKSINDLMQSDTVAQVFSSAMNRITGSITDFLKSLKPEDIDKFADTALKFLQAFTELTLMAANAVIYFAKHLPEMGAAFGAFEGAQLGAQFGGWKGALAGMLIGAGAGYAGGKYIQKGMPGVGPSEQDQMSSQIGDLERQIADLQQRQRTSDGSLMGSFTTDDYRRLQLLQKQKTDLLWQQSLALNSQYNDSMQPLDTPLLPGLRDMVPDKDQPGYLQKNFGINGMSKQQEALLRQQNRYLENLLAKYQSVTSPETDRFDSITTTAKRLGVSMDRKVTLPDGTVMTVQQMVDALQADYNQKQQAVSDRKTASIDTQFKSMQMATETELDKFKETYNIANLLTPDEQTWQNQAQKMKTQLNKTLDQLGVDMKKRAAQNPLYAFEHPDIDGEVAQMRKIGDAYIAEFKRIEAEKRSILGGGKTFLKDWNDTVTNYGAITKSFLDGTVQNVQDMLFNFVKTGKMSWDKLGQFVIDYMIKVMIAQSITPMINQGVGLLMNWASGFFSPTTMTGSSMYSLSSGSSGLGLHLPGRASGGPVGAGGTYIVGENGPEVLQMGPSAGYVTPNEMLRGGNHGDVTVNVTVNGDGSSNVQSSGMDKLGRKLGDAVRSIIIDERRPGGLLA